MAKITVTRPDSNPILIPNPNILWEAEASFNPAVIFENNTYKMLYRALSVPLNYNGQKLNLSTVGFAQSQDGKVYSGKRQLVVPTQKYEAFGCEDPRLTKIGNEYFIFYTAISAWPPTAESIKVAVAISPDLENISEKHLVTPFNAKAMVLFPEKINGQYVAILTVNTDLPPSKVALAYFDKKEDIWSEVFWKKWYAEIDQHLLYLPRFNTDQVEVGAVPVKTADGWVLIYSHIQNYYQEQNRIFGVEAVLLDLEQPEKILGRSTEAIFQPEVDYELNGMIKNVIFPTGALIKDDNFQIFYGAADTVGAVVTIKLNLFLSLLKQSSYREVYKFHKYLQNPIFEPSPDKPWQAQAVFNAGAIYESGKFYLMYRAMSWDNSSVIGCAISDDGYHFHDATDLPAYVPRESFEQKKQPPNGFSGCEDPRLTKFGDKIYMFYTAYDGLAPPQVALTAISVENFVAQNWQWDKPKLISNPLIDNKNACLFPEKINEKFVILHRTAGEDIALDFVADLNFENNNQLEKEAAIMPRPESWDSAKIGISGPPIKTELGWLLIYHGVSKFDKNYRLGYMILDLNDPFNVLYRSPFPILEPEFNFEKKGVVENVVFSCGAVEKDGQIFLYYGGADRVMAVATFEIAKLISVIGWDEIVKSCLIKPKLEMQN